MLKQRVSVPARASVMRLAHAAYTRGLGAAIYRAQHWHFFLRHQKAPPDRQGQAGADMSHDKPGMGVSTPTRRAVWWPRPYRSGGGGAFRAPLTFVGWG